MGENRLADRLLAIKDVRDTYQKVVKDLASTAFRKERLLADWSAIEGATKAILAREVAARTREQSRRPASAHRVRLGPRTCGSSRTGGRRRLQTSSRGRRTAIGRGSTLGRRAEGPRRSR